MRRPHRWMIVLAALLPLVACSQEDTTIKSWDFEADLGGWESMDPDGKVSRTQAADAVFEGTGALEFTFQQGLPEGGDAEPPGVCGVEIGVAPVGLRSVRFAVATAFSGPIAVLLLEEDESAYMAAVWSEAGRWNQCDLALSDFLLSRDDSTDENDRLDPDQIVSIAIADGSVFVRGLAKEGVPVFVHPPTEMSIWLDEVALSSAEAEEAPGGPEVAEGRVIVDACDSQTVQWVSIGGDEASLTTHAGDGRKHLRVRYSVPVGTIFGLLRGVPVGRLTDCAGLSFEMNCELGANLFVMVEEADGSRYVQAPSGVAAGGWRTVELPFSGFALEESASDDNGRLDAEQIARVAIVDIAAALQNVLSANTWDVRNLCGMK